MNEGVTILAAFCIGTYLLYKWIESTETKYEIERMENRRLAERFVQAFEKIAESKGATT